VPARDVAHEWSLHAWRVEVGRQLAAVGGDGNSAVAVATGALSKHASGTVGLSGRYYSTGPGPILCTVLFCNYSNFAQISKYKVKIIPMSKIIETWHGARVDPITISPIGSTSNSQQNSSYKIGNNSTLNFSLNF
jgi:hypothetical protein